MVSYIPLLENYLNKHLRKQKMRLDHSTWLEIETYLENSKGIVIPTGSTEQHGPMGLIGTDAICVEEIANRGAKYCRRLCCANA